MLNGVETEDKDCDGSSIKEQKLQKIFDFLASVDKDVDELSHYNVSSILELKILSVDFKYRGRGIAGKLYELTEQLARNKGFQVR